MCPSPVLSSGGTAPPSGCVVSASASGSPATRGLLHPAGDPASDLAFSLPDLGALRPGGAALALLRTFAKLRRRWRLLAN